jgi:putative oxidoreductase
MALNPADVKKLLQDHDLGLLFIRIALGGSMMAYGIPKFMGGMDALAQVGQAMQYVGIHGAFHVWGLLAALIEVVGGLMILLGFLFRPAAFALILVMLIATLFQGHTHQAKDFVANALHPLSYMGVFMGLLFSGPGKWSLQKN